MWHCVCTYEHVAAIHGERVQRVRIATASSSCPYDYTVVAAVVCEDSCHCIMFATYSQQHWRGSHCSSYANWQQKGSTFIAHQLHIVASETLPAYRIMFAYTTTHTHTFHCARVFVMNKYTNICQYGSSKFCAYHKQKSTVMSHAARIHTHIYLLIYRYIGAFACACINDGSSMNSRTKLYTIRTQLYSYGSAPLTIYLQL